MATSSISKTEWIERYKRILAQVLDNRPSGTRLKLANALGKNRSFVSQIVNPAYSTPIPTQHLPTLLDVCHFSQAERRAFLDAYAKAHPQHPLPQHGKPRTRSISVSVPDLGDAERNRLIDEMLADWARKIAHLAEILSPPTQGEDAS